MKKIYSPAQRPIPALISFIRRCGFILTLLLAIGCFIAAIFSYTHCFFLAICFSILAWVIAQSDNEEEIGF